MLAQRMKTSCQVCTLFLNLLSRIDDLLVQNLIAIGEIGHASAENHRVLIHTDSNIAFLRDQLCDRSSILCSLENFDCRHEFFLILNLEEVFKADRRFQLLASRHPSQESRKVLLAFRQKFLSHLIRLHWQGRNQNLRELSFQDAAQGVKIRIFALDLPSQWLCRDRVQHIVTCEESAFAHLGLSHLKRYLLTV